MYRVKSVSEIKMYPGMVLLNVILKESKITAPGQMTNNSKNPLVDYAIVIAKSEDINNLEVGDIALEFSNTTGFQWQDKHYCIIPRNSIKLAVSRENFDESAVDPSKTKITKILN